MSREGFSPKPRVFISYARKDGEEFATRLRKKLEEKEPEITLWQDRAEMEGGVGWWKQIEEALDQVRFLVIVMTPAAMQSEMTRKEWRYARQRGISVYPVKGCPDAAFDYASLPNWMSKAHFFDLDRECETFVNYLKSDREPKRVAFMAPDMPECLIPRPREFEQLIAQLVDPKHENPIAITAPLQGAGGYGKTTLAIAVCHDDRVIDAFDDGILWVTLGQNPNVLAELTKLYKALTGDQPTFVDEKDAELKLREKLENRNCLLVIDDVWQRTHLESFLQGGKKTCARLITTRRSDFVMDAKRIRVDEMTPEESVALLVARLPGEHKPHDLRPFRHLAARLMDWPLLLKLAAGVIGARVERGDILEGSLDYVNRVYDKRGLTAFDPKDAVKRNDAVAKSIQATLELLGQDEQTRLAELAIFPENTDVPLHLIEVFWDLDDLDTQDTLQRFADYALLDLDLRAGIVRLHDEIRSYLVRTIGDEPALHRRLVDRAQDPRRLEDRYLLRWLPWHLWKADRETQLRTLLFDFEWILAKLAGADIQSLIADYNYLPHDGDLRLVQSAIRLSAHVLARDQRQLAAQLIGRLLGDIAPNIQALLKQAAEKAHLPWLRPLKQSLTAPGGPLIRTLEGHTDLIRAVAIAHVARRIISASDDRTLRVWDLGSGQTVHTLHGHAGAITAVAMTPDGRRAISGSTDRTLRVWNLETGQILGTLLGHTDTVHVLAISPDGCRAVSGSYDDTLRLWDLETGREVRKLDGHTRMVTAVAVTPDGRRAVSGSWDETLRVWDLESGHTVRTLKGHTGKVTGVVIIPRGLRALSSSYDCTLRVWDLERGQIVHTLQGHKDPIISAAMTPDGRHAVSASGFERSTDRTLRVWDLHSGQLVRVLGGYTGTVRDVALASDELHVVLAIGLSLQVWDLESTRATRRHEEYASRITAVAITPDGRRAVSGSMDCKLQVWDPESSQTMRTLQGHTNEVKAVALTSDARRVLSAAKHDCKLQLWDPESGQLLHTLEAHRRDINSIAVTSDGRRAVSASTDCTLRVWDLESGQLVRTLEGHTRDVIAVAITPDGQRAVSGSIDRTLRLWDLESGQTLTTLDGHRREVIAAVITPDGHRVLSASYDRTLRVWDFESGQTVRTLEDCRWMNSDVALTIDGRRAISASSGGTLCVWDLESGKEIAAFTVESPLLCCAVVADGSTIVAGDKSGRVHFLRLEGVD